MAATPDHPRFTWNEVAGVFTRPQPVTLPMVTLFAIIPVYLAVGVFVSHGTLHAPELALDRALPLRPAWSAIYGSLFVAAFLPVFVLHQQELIRRTILAYLTVCLSSFSIFLFIPTPPPQPTQ